MASFPDYLLIHLKKFTVKEDWTPIKLDVAVEMPDTLDLGSMRGSGLQPNEELLPDGATPPPPVYDAAILKQLADMGFPSNACKRALYFTENRSLQDATNWVMEHIADSNFDEPFVPPGVDLKSGNWIRQSDDKAMVEILFVVSYVVFHEFQARTNSWRIRPRWRW